MSDSLKTDKTIDKHLHMLKTESGEISSLSVSTEGNGAKVTGDLNVTGDIDVKGGVSVPLDKEITAGNHSIADVSTQTEFKYHDNSYMKVGTSDIYSPTELTLAAGRVTTNVPHFLKERASADIDQAGFGQIWVRSSSPADLYYTDDTGQDVRITNNGSLSAATPSTVQYYYETKVCNYYTNSVNDQFIPLAGYIVERDSITGQNEYVSMVAPYDGTIEKIMFRSEIAQNGTLEYDILESTDGTEVPGTTIGSKDTVINIADDTTQEVSFSSMSSGTNALTKGRIYAIQIDTPSAPYDTNITVVFKWDVTS